MDLMTTNAKRALIGGGVVVAGLAVYFVVNGIGKGGAAETGRTEFALRENIEMFSQPKDLSMSTAKRAEFDKVLEQFLAADSEWWALYAKGSSDQKRKWRTERLTQQEAASSNTDDLARIKEFERITKGMLDGMK